MENPTALVISLAGAVLGSQLVREVVAHFLNARNGRSRQQREDVDRALTRALRAEHDRDSEADRRREAEEELAIARRVIIQHLGPDALPPRHNQEASDG